MNLAAATGWRYEPGVPMTPVENPAPGGVDHRLRNVWREIVLAGNHGQRRRLAVGTILLVPIIGLLDYESGFEVSLFLIYCLPVMIGTAALGWRFGLLIAMLSVASGLVSDNLAGAHYTSMLVPVGKGLMALFTYLVFIWLFDAVQTLQLEMQERVRQRTAALTAEIALRQRLENSLLEISERERATVGRELHDNLGQHLTGTAFAGQVLGEKLRARDLPEQADAAKLVSLIEEGIEKTRRLARGLLFAEIQQDGLVAALTGLADEASTQFHIACEFQLLADCPVSDPRVASHLLRITQEAVNNAFRHGAATRIEVLLDCSEDPIELTIRDNGRGLPPPGVRNDGLGLQIMAHRAQMIGGEFAIEPAEEQGTLVRCRVPRVAPSHESITVR
jgi:signal transduction histidine kinase